MAKEGQPTELEQFDICLINIRKPGMIDAPISTC
jgi:hypothetical protein